MRRFASFAVNRSGATLIEFTLIFTVLMVLTFGLIEFGIALYQYNAAETATAIGARYIATRGPVVTGIADCGVATNASAGTSCASVAGASSWTVTCNAAAPPAAARRPCSTDWSPGCGSSRPKSRHRTCRSSCAGRGWVSSGAARPCPW